MKILFFEWKNFGREDVIDSLHRLGHDVTCITSQLIHDRFNSEFDELFEKSISMDSFDCVFTFNYSPIISQNCNKRNIKYIALIYDSPLVSLYSYTIINPCNYVFIFDSAQYLEFKQNGINTVYYIPLAVNTDRLDKMVPDSDIVTRYSSDVSFIGSMYNEKHNLYERLKNLTPYTQGFLDGIMAAQLKVYGYFFIEDLLTGSVLEDMMSSLEYKPNPDGVETPAYIYANYFIARKLAETERKNLLSLVSARFDTKLYTPNPTPDLPDIKNMGAIDYYDTMPYIFKCSKINLNITLRSIKNGIPLRAMDIMGSCGFLLTNYQQDFLEHFVPGEDFAYYESEEDLLEKCAYYLSHESERTQISQNAYGKIKEFHTYEKRFQQIFDIVF